MNYQRAVNISRFVLVLLIIGFLLSVALAGVDTLGISSYGFFERGTIAKGKDFGEGILITYDTADDVSADGMKSALKIVKKRLDIIGLPSSAAYLIGDDTIAIELPPVSNAANAAASVMGQGVLEVKDANGKLILAESDINRAKAKSGILGDTHQYYVELSLTKDGAKKYAQATKYAANATGDANKISFYLDGSQVASLTIDKKYAETGVVNGKTQITGNFDPTVTKALAAQLNAGSLPYVMKVSSEETLAPSMGENTLRYIVIAIAIALGVAALAAIVVFKLPGLFASFSFVGFIAMGMLGMMFAGSLRFTVYSLIGVIAAILIAVAMNVLLLARFKDEVKQGKTAKAAGKAAFARNNRLFIEILVVAVIICTLIYLIGNIEIKEAAFTLLFGAPMAYVSMYIFAKPLFNLGSSMGLKAKLFGATREVSDRE